MQPAADLDEDPPDPAEQPRPFEPEILAIAHARPRVAQDPAEHQPPDGPARQAPVDLFARAGA